MASCDHPGRCPIFREGKNASTVLSEFGDASLVLHVVLEPIRVLLADPVHARSWGVSKTTFFGGQGLPFDSNKLTAPGCNPSVAFPSIHDLTKARIVPPKKLGTMIESHGVLNVVRVVYHSPAGSSCFFDDKNRLPEGVQRFCVRRPKPESGSNDENGVVHSFPMLRSPGRGLCFKSWITASAAILPDRRAAFDGGVGGPVAAPVEALIPCFLARPAWRLRERLPHLDRGEVFDMVCRKIEPNGQRLADVFNRGRGSIGLEGGIHHRFPGGVVRGHEAGGTGVKDRCIWLLVQVGQVQDRGGVLWYRLANAIIWVDRQAVEVGGLVSMMA